MTDAPTDITELAVIPKESALAVLTDPARFDDFYERVAKTVRDVPVDLTTAAGRKAVAALAFKVVKSKTAILASADELTADARAQIKKVNESKGDIEMRLNALRDEVRKPLTDWETAEEEREKQATATLEIMRSAAVVMASETAAELQSRLEAVIENEPDAAILGDHFQIAMNLRDSAADALSEGIARAKKAEADAAELVILREQQAKRDQEDQERRDREEQERVEREAEETRQREAREAQEAEEQAERDRIAAEEQAEAERVANEERIAQEARDATQREADAAAEAQRVETEQRHAQELADQRAETERAEAERQRLADEQAERERVAKEQADAAAARAADREHKSKVMRTAKLAIIQEIKPYMPEGFDPENMAVSIVRAIVAGEIPAVTLAF